MKNIVLILSLLAVAVVKAQSSNNCGLQENACTSPSFSLNPIQPSDIQDFPTPSASNPSSNPGSGNSGCLLSGETSSTYVLISVVSAGTLGWTLGTNNGSGCYDWIMWPYVSDAVTCAGLLAGNIAPVRCNWNGGCEGYTGMANPGSLPAGAGPENFEPMLNAVAGQQFLLCISNYSGVTATAPFSLTGTAVISCTGLAPDQTICLGETANVTITTQGLSNPTYTWLNTTGVSNIVGNTAQINVNTTTSYTVNVTSGSVTVPVTFTITVVAPPIPNAGSDQTVCFGLPFSLSGSISNPTDTKSWAQLPNPGFTPPAVTNFAPSITSLTPSVTPNTATTYSYVLTQTNPECPPKKDTVNITFQKVLLTATKTDPLCGGSADGTITISSVLGTEFSFDNGGTWQTSPTKTGLTAGTYQVCARSSIGCQTCISMVLTAPAPVVMTLSNDITICQNGSTTLVAAFSGGGNSFTYNWGSFGIGGAFLNVSPIATTTYTCFAINENNCTSTIQNVTVTVLPGLDALPTTNISVCPGFPGKIGASAFGGNGGPYLYSWSEGSYTDSITVSPTSTTTYTVTIRDNCESTPIIRSVVVTMLPLPVVDFTCPVPEQCEKGIFTVVNATDSAMSASTLWVVSNGQTFADTNQITTEALVAGTYSVQLIVASPAGCIDSLTKGNFLISHKKPKADFYYAPTPVLMFDTDVRFQNISVDGTNFTWSFPAATPPYSSEENPTTLYPDGIVAVYDVMLIVESDFGCLDTIVKQVNVLPEVVFYAPNTFTPDGDEFNQDWIFVLSGIDPADFNLKIFDRWGQVIWETNDVSSSWDGSLNGNIVKDGVYSWLVTTKDAINDKKYRWSGNVNVIR